MRESQSNRQVRTQTIIQRLKREYPAAHCALHHDSPFQLLLATVLSAQCTDERVNRVTPALFQKYPTPADLAAAELSDLEVLVHATGFFRAKARSLKGIGERIARDHRGQVPQDLEALTSMPGVGRKTANVVLGNAFGMATGVVVDTHVKRLSFRLGLTREKSPERVERDLIELVPKKEWVLFPHLLITHGREVCKARSPQCHVCVLEGQCPKRGIKH